MSTKKAQNIVNEVHRELGFSLTIYNNVDLEYLRSKLEDLLEQDVDMEELNDPADVSSDDMPELDETDEEYVAATRRNSLSHDDDWDEEDEDY
jgi:hypothetical protein